MLLMIDNYDSFTYNLVDYFCYLGVKVQVYRNDELLLHDIEALNPSYIVISPGPRTPNEAGISLQAVSQFANRIPILGVCLGHQCIGQVFGAKVVQTDKVMHGKMSLVHHSQKGLFAGLQQPLRVTRYHSLVLQPDTLPDSLQVDAWTHDAEGNPEHIMAISHRDYPIWGVQFHPESLMTQQGHDLLNNFLQQPSG